MFRKPQGDFSSFVGPVGATNGRSDFDVFEKMDALCSIIMYHPDPDRSTPQLEGFQETTAMPHPPPTCKPQGNSWSEAFLSCTNKNCLEDLSDSIPQLSVQERWAFFEKKKTQCLVCGHFSIFAAVSAPIHPQDAGHMHQDDRSQGLCRHRQHGGIKLPTRPGSLFLENGRWHPESGESIELN